MKFSGRLHTGPEPGNAAKSESNPANWLRTDLSLVGGRVELKAGDDLLGSWSTSQVKAQRLEGDRFELSLGGDRAVFAADDALGFSYDALPHLSKKPLPPVSGGIRGKLLGGKRASGAEAHVEVAFANDEATVATSVATEVETPAPPEAGSAPVARRLRDLVEAARGAGTPEGSKQMIDVDSIPITIVARNEVIPIAGPLLAEPVFDEPRGNGSVSPGPASIGADSKHDLVFMGVEDPASVEPVPASVPKTIASLEPVEFDTRPWNREAEQDSQPIDLRPLFAKSGASDPSRNGSLQRVVAAMEGIADQVRDGSMTTAQVDAISTLLDSVTALISAGHEEMGNG